MHCRQVMVKNQTGIHARPAADFVQAAKKFQSAVSIRKVDGGEFVNAKSIVRLLSQGITRGTVVEISADGEDEYEAVDSLVALVESGFGE